MSENKINVQTIQWLPQSRQVLDVNFEGGYFLINSDGEVVLSIHEERVTITGAQLNDRVYRNAIGKSDFFVRLIIAKTVNDKNGGSDD